MELKQMPRIFMDPHMVVTIAKEQYQAASALRRHVRDEQDVIKVGQ